MTGEPTPHGTAAACRIVLARLCVVCLLLLVVPGALAQSAAKLPRIGFISPLSATANPNFEAFRQGLQDHGWVDGRNVIVEARFAEGRLERLPALAAELVALPVDVLLAGSPAGAAAAKKATSTLSIVFAGVGDPVGAGLVPSLARPGGNITGTTVGIGDSAFGAKWLDLLKAVVPGMTRVALLANRSNPSNALYFQGVVAAAPALSVKVEVFDAGNEAELERALAAVAGSGAQGLIVSTDPFLLASRDKIVAFAARRRVPTIYFFKIFVDAGGLMSYGASIEDSYRRAALYVDKVLKGAKPGEMAVEQPTRFELAVNKSTAKALGITVPQLVLLQADHILE
jgi:putative ABC transport system substrate-binding protein